MTDLATRSDADETPADDATPVTETDASAPADGDGSAPVLAWSPPAPAPRRRHLALWLGIPAGIAAIALVASSLVLIAPGTSVAGVEVGGMTPGAAADALQNQLARTTIVLVGADGDPEFTGAELGASLDSRALAERAYSEHPAWNLSTWFSDPLSAAVRIDAEVATAALRDAAPELYTDPTDASIAFDAASASFAVTAAVPGTGVDVETVRLALQSALATGDTRVELQAQAADVAALTSTTAAERTVATLNGMLETAGFYVGEERTVPIDRALVASWLTVEADGEGSFDISADAAAIQPVVDGLAPLVNRAAEDGKVITDSAGKVLREDAPGISGRALGDTSTVAPDYAAQLASGDAAYVLPVTEVAPVVVTVARRIEVDISEQRAYLFENGAVVSSYRVSSGVYGSDTDYGRFRITSKLRSQNMGNRDLTKAPFYFTPNVPYVMYYNGDEALHGAYWHNNFGRRMSHGCVNLPVDVAAYLYTWAPLGTEVWVHA